MKTAGEQVRCDLKRLNDTFSRSFLSLEVGVMARNQQWVARRASRLTKA